MSDNVELRNTNYFTAYNMQLNQYCIPLQYAKGIKNTYILPLTYFSTKVHFPL